MIGDGPSLDVRNGASFGTALRMALCRVVIVSRRSAGRVERNPSGEGRGSFVGMPRGWRPMPGEQTRRGSGRRERDLAGSLPERPVVAAAGDKS